jgi:phage portal protein BeeE
MKLFGFNISRERRQTAPATKSLSAACDPWLTGDDPGYGGLTLSNAYQQVVWVYRAINVLAEQIGNIPFLFSSGDRGRENLITHGPLVDFYEHPHPHINRFQYWELRIIWLMLRGECFRIPIYETANSVNSVNSVNLVNSVNSVTSVNSPRRRLSRIIILDPACFQHIVEDHQLIGWRYTGFGGQTPLSSQVLLPEEVWHEKLPNPFNFWRGLAPLQVAGLAAATDFAAAEYMKGVMENNGDLGLIVRAEEQLGPEQREQLRAALRQRRRRAGMANEPLLLWNTTEIVQPQLSSSDLQFLENRKFSRGEICAAFGVPEEIVTTTDNAKYDVMQGARLNFIEHRIAPMCRRLEASEDVTVKSLDPRAVGWFDLDSLPLMQKAQRDRLATARSVFDMGVPFNELNRVLDLGFRRLPWGDRGYVASRLMEVGDEAAAAKVDSGAAAAPREGADSRKLIVDRKNAGPRSADHQASTIGHELSRMSTWLETLNQSPADAASGPVSEEIPVPVRVLSAGAPRGHQQSTINYQLVRKLRRYFFEQRSRVLASLLSEPPVAPEQLKTRAPMDLFDWAGEATKAAEIKFPPEIDAQLAEKLLRGLKDANAELKQVLTNALADGVQQGETPEQLGHRVRAIYNDVIDAFVNEVMSKAHRP